MNKTLDFGFEIKSIDDSTGIIEGYASTFKNIDLGGDMVMPGAFKKTLRENKGKFPILDSHDPTKQIGWNLEAKEDGDGLFVRGELDIQNNQNAREKYSLIKKALEIKAKAGLSIGYRPIKWEMDEDMSKMRYRKLTEVRLFEYSPVAFPMNEMAMATAAKQIETAIKDGSADALEIIQKSIAIMSDEGCTKEEIKSALETAAAQFGKPSPQVAHLFEAGLNIFKKL